MKIKQHIRGSVLGDDNSCISLCGELVPFGNWKAGAAYEGLRIVGMGADEFCSDCQREWIRLHSEKP